MGKRLLFLPLPMIPLLLRLSLPKTSYRIETDSSSHVTRFVDYRLMFDLGRSFSLEYDRIRSSY